jgi:hypothetical protein
VKGEPHCHTRAGKCGTKFTYTNNCPFPLLFQDKEEKKEVKKEGKKEEEDKKEEGDKDEKKDEEKESDEKKDDGSETKEAGNDEKSPDSEKVKGKGGFFKLPKFMKRDSEEKVKEEATKETEMKDMSEEKEKEKEKEEEEGKEQKGEEDKEDKEKDDDGAEKKEEEKKIDEEKKKDPAELEKVPGFFHNLKSMNPFGKKAAATEKDPEAGDKEESKELLEKVDEKKDEVDEGANKDEKKEGEEATEGEEKKEKTEKVDEEVVDGAKKRSAGVGFLGGLKGFFKSSASKDVEAGEKKELLDAEEGKDAEEEDEDSNKKLENTDEVNVVNEKKDPDAVSTAGSEKKDAEKSGTLSPGKKAASDKCATQQPGALKCQRCVRIWHETDKNKKCFLCAAVSAILLIVLFVVLIALCTRPSWTNEARISVSGRFIVTHTTCGPVQGVVDSPDQFSFRGIPYAVPVLEDNRFTHSRAPSSLAECFEGQFVAHNEANESDSLSSRCLRKMPQGIKGDENCLSLDIFTSNVVYNELMPVVVYVGGEDLTEEQENNLAPSSGENFIQPLTDMQF